METQKNVSCNMRVLYKFELIFKIYTNILSFWVFCYSLYRGMDKSPCFLFPSSLNFASVQFFSHSSMVPLEPNLVEILLGLFSIFYIIFLIQKFNMTTSTRAIMISEKYFQIILIWNLKIIIGMFLDDLLQDVCGFFLVVSCVN